MWHVCCIKVLYACFIFSVVWNCLSLKFLKAFLKLKVKRSRLMWASSWVISTLQSNQKNVILDGISYRLSENIFTTNSLYLTLSFLLFWNSKCRCGSLRENWKQSGSLLMWAFSWVGSILQSNHKNVIPDGLSCRIYDDNFITNCLFKNFLLLFFKIA